MATVLIVDDEPALREGLAETIADLGHEPVLAASGREALARLAANPDIAAVLLDLRMPGDLDGIAVLKRIRDRPRAPPAVVLTAYASAENTIEAMRLGAFDHLTKPVGREELRALLGRMLSLRAPGEAAPAAPAAAAETCLVGSSEAMRRVQKAIGLAADSDATVLLQGETGTGKEVVARALHDHGRRWSAPFVPVNCAAIPAELLESELFGHVKGAFTGAAADRPGAFREAQGGTLFLDEIGDMPPAMQAKILRAIQDKVVTPVGGRPVAVEMRVVAATHRDLPALVASGGFRQDLYYRLNVIPIVLPPLRERLADILPLAEHFLALGAGGGGVPRRLTPQAAARLLRYDWPGNVRELRNIIERAAVLVRGEVIDAADLDLPGFDRPGGPAPEDWLSGDLPTAVARLEKAMIARALQESSGNRAQAAKRLGIQRQLLYAKIERYGLADRGGGTSERTTPGVGKDDT
ncbi:sigma-54-dependent transcriptional regulator [Methylobacterium nodulans]|uniref:Two component, sigma54 specific, transcriptional regulator, Fis family n=1 Tax=Methylobacterium nodulans (strain LMG 21967 / CNCM I-2342 / ORS 2060) TaxID=460265 RepID=B8IB91_METNO|nr:sigma-54 dependent transcriptional regulator [Methylobacterium nodulans]ACL57306.1 two component, sigma54 specific, transcriptional regulator, Fis family [Methylobacterium nodulans ORS 2060]